MIAENKCVFGGKKRLRQLCSRREFYFSWTVFFVLFCSLQAYAQYEPLLHKPYRENVLGIHSMYADLINIKDSTLQANKAEEIKLFARNNKDRSLENNVDFFLNFWNAFYRNQPQNVSLTKLTLQVEKYTKENIDFLLVRSLRALAEYYWKFVQNYELAFEQYLILDNELKKSKAADYPEMARDFMQIGEAHYYFRDYHSANRYFKQAISLPENEFNTEVLNAARNNLGLSYQHLNKLDSSDYFFREVLKTSFAEAKVWKRIAKGNLGTNQYLRGSYDQAIPLLESDFYGATRENDFGCAAGAAIILADIFREKGKLEVSRTFIDYAIENIEKAWQPERFRLLYPVMSKWYSATGNAQLSKQYLDSSVLAINRYNEKYSALKVLRAQQKVDRQEQELKQASITLEKERKTAERNLLFVLVMLLCVVMVLSYYIQRKRQQVKDLKLQKASQDLEIAKQSLKIFTENIQKKNKLIEELERQLDSDTDLTLVQQLQKSTILTEDDWQNFKFLFEQVHGGFLQRLKEKYPNFSPAETRFISLAKLSFSTKEMATALGVSSQSIRTNWYRIKKKLDLSDTVTPKELVEDI